VIKYSLTKIYINFLCNNLQPHVSTLRGHLQAEHRVYIYIIEKNEMGGTSSSDGGGERRLQVLVGKPEGQRTLARPRRRWEDTIKMDLQGSGMGGYGLDWAGLG
jgi:hypothetical protein